MSTPMPPPPPAFNPTSPVPMQPPSVAQPQYGMQPLYGQAPQQYGQFQPAYGQAPPGYVLHQPGQGGGLPGGVSVASPWLRFGSYLLEGVLMLVTLYIGWLIWAAMTASHGQTPAKRLLHIRVIDAHTLKPVGFARMFFMRGIVGTFVAELAIVFTIGILLFMPFWDKRNQNIWDKVSGTYVVMDPHDVWATKRDLR